MDLQREQVVIGPDAGFHMLRHFQHPSSDMMKAIRRNGHSEAEINHMLIAAGSRFSGAFAQSIEALLDQVFQYPYTLSTGITGNVELCWDIPKDEWPDGIGTTSVVSMQSLNEQQLSNLCKKENRGLSLWHLQVDAMPNTSQCALILKPSVGEFAFITAFPGSASLPLPDKRMSDEVFTICKDFWDRQVFLVSNT